MTNKLRSTERNPGAEMMERLFTESFQNSYRPPFRGTINVDKQVLDLLDYANQFFSAVTTQLSICCLSVPMQ
jgi:hypothetical protein